MAGEFLSGSGLFPGIPAAGQAPGTATVVLRPEDRENGGNEGGSEPMARAVGEQAAPDQRADERPAAVSGTTAAGRLLDQQENAVIGTPVSPEAVKDTSPDEDELRRKDEAILKWQREADRALVDIQKHLADPETLATKFPLPALLLEGEDPAAVQRALMIDRYLTIGNGMREVEPGSPQRDALRSVIAGKKFGGRGAEDDAAFYQEIRKEAVAENGHRQMDAFVRARAKESAILRPSRTAERSDWVEVRKELVSKPGYDPGREVEYLRGFLDHRKENIHRNARIQTHLDHIARILSPADGASGPEQDSFAPLSDADADVVVHLISEAGSISLANDPRAFIESVSTLTKRLDSADQKTLSAANARLKKQDSSQQTAAIARAALADTLQKNGLFNSATSAMGADPSTGITRKADGDWDAPYMVPTVSVPYFPDPVVNTIGGLIGTVRQKTGARLDNAGPALDQKKIQKVFHDFQQKYNLSDSEVQNAWTDLATLISKWEKDEHLRVLSDGLLVPNPEDPAWMDAGKAHDLIMGSPASPQSKSRALQEMRDWRIQMASTRAAAFAAASGAADIPSMMGLVAGEFVSPHEWAKKNHRTDFASPEFMVDYEREVISKHGWAQGLTANIHKGNIALMSQIGGLGGFLGIDFMGEMGAEMAEASDLIGRGSFDTGIVGSVVEQASPLFAQIALTRGLGSGAAAGQATSRGAMAARGFGMISVAGVQSLSATYSERLAAGDSEEMAREKAARAGVATSLITGIFSALGAGGVEKVAMGRMGGQVTIRDLLASASRKELMEGTRKFAADVLKSGAGEFAEEGLDQLVQSFLTADPDTNLADAWDNALRSAAIGGSIGIAVDLAGKTGRTTPWKSGTFSDHPVQLVIGNPHEDGTTSAPEYPFGLPDDASSSQELELRRIAVEEEWAGIQQKALRRGADPVAAAKAADQAASAVASVRMTWQKLKSSLSGKAPELLRGLERACDALAAAAMPEPALAGGVPMNFQTNGESSGKSPGRQTGASSSRRPRGQAAGESQKPAPQNKKGELNSPEIFSDADPTRSEAEPETDPVPAATAANGNVGGDPIDPSHPQSGPGNKGSTQDKSESQETRRVQETDASNAESGSKPEDSADTAKNYIPILASTLAKNTNTPLEAWTNGANGHLDGPWTKDEAVSANLLQLAVATGPGSSPGLRAKALANATPLQRQAFGISAEDSAAIDAAAKRGPASLRRAAGAAMKNRNAHGIESESQVPNLSLFITKQAAEHMSAPHQTTITRSSNGTYELLDTTTQEILLRGKTLTDMELVTGSLPSSPLAGKPDIPLPVALEKDSKTTPGSNSNLPTEPKIVSYNREARRMESRVDKKLKGKFKNANVYREVYLRYQTGKIAKDPATGTGRRIDHAVIENGKLRFLVETTNKTADKSHQQAKEARIIRAGGFYIRDRKTRILVSALNTKTKIIRLK